MNVPYSSDDFSGKDPRAVKVPCILGDCTIQLSHATTYEPPFYLFPELLKKVPQGTPPLWVWDAVADVVDVQNSSWRIADMQELASSSTSFSPSEGEKKGGGEGSEKGNSARSAAVHTLASLIASNRLLQAGLTPSALSKDKFSAARMLEELVRLQSRAGLGNEEGAVLMTNHFVNLLAWRKLCEVNYGAAFATGKEGLTCENEKTREKEGNSRRRARVKEEEEDLIDRMRPCMDPWSDEIDDPANAGVFISGREENVEQKVELLETLSQLYERPWRRMRSQGCQTEYILPPGTMNVTNPYANGQPFRERRGEETVDTTTPNNNFLKIIENLASRAEKSQRLNSGYTLLIRSTTLPEVEKRRVDFEGGAFNTRKSTLLFGRSSGLQYGISGDPIYIDVGLSVFTSHPQTLSTLHFALIRRSKRCDEMKAKSFRESISSSSSEAAPGNKSTSNHRYSDEESERVCVEKCANPIHPEDLLESTLWIINYGRNEVAVIRNSEESSLEKTNPSSSRWIHIHDALQLQAGDEIVLGDGEIRISLITTHEQSNNLDRETLRIKNEEEGDGKETPLSVVKKECMIEEECEV
ncbi:unnamed protein product [Phytomonas sp. Hart1]|nr:unnamed protein product [Phytomonas sp. Hart1]|eukprot:CCW69450.1 unnamed protein product [Phytomonas sp. isolate Hart1]